MSDESLPYRTTPVFDETSLPKALRREHSTKDGVWGVVRVIEGQLRLALLDSREEEMLTPQRPGLILPAQPHHVTPDGPMKMQVEFYDRPPNLEAGASA